MARLPFSNEIRTLRFLAGEMTQGDLGDMVGVTRQTIAAIEQGKYSPSLEVAFRIARVFDKPLEAVFQWNQTLELKPEETEIPKIKAKIENGLPPLKPQVPAAADAKEGLPRKVDPQAAPGKKS